MRSPRSAGRSDRSPTAARPRPPRTPSALKALVVGDSQAATLAQGVRADPGVYGLSAQPGLTVWNRAILGCPIVSYPVFVLDGNHVSNKCGGTGFWQRQWASDVATFRPDAVVVMAGAWDVFDAVMPDGSGRARRQPGVRRDLRHVTSATLLDTLHATGAPVVVVKPPCFGESHLVGTDPQIPQRRDIARLAAIDTAWTEAAHRHGARVLDLDSVLCPGGIADAARAARRCALRRRRCRPRRTRRGHRGATSSRRRHHVEWRRVIDDRRRRRGCLALTAAAIVTIAGCQGGTDTTQSATAPSTSTTSTSTPPPTRPVGNPWPQIGKAPPEHHAILAMGDSLMGGTYFTLPQVLAAHGFDAAVYDAHVSASGLLDPMNGYSARDYLALPTRGPPRCRHCHLRMGGRL